MHFFFFLHFLNFPFIGVTMLGPCGELPTVEDWNQDYKNFPTKADLDSLIPLPWVGDDSHKVAMVLVDMLQHDGTPYLCCSRQLLRNQVHDYYNYYYNSMKSRRGYILTAVCLPVCVSVCPALLVNKNSSRKDHPIWTRFLLNGCLPHWLKPN